MSPKTELERAAKRGAPSVLADWAAYLRGSGKWWLLPVVLVLLILGTLLMLTSTPAAPFIYSLF